MTAEERCQRPGLWWIDGYQVVRRGRRWWIYRPTEDGGKTLVDRVNLLDVAREHIAARKY